jgi:hypothetical protein
VAIGATAAAYTTGKPKEQAAGQGRPKYFPCTDGGANMNEAAAESVAFGPYVLASRPAIVYFPGMGGKPVHQPDGLFEATVGNALFAHSVVTLDFHSMRISVQPGQAGARSGGA